MNGNTEWIHVKDDKGRNALHYAASIGYLDGVQYLLRICVTCHMERDNDGLFPLHLASACGHTEVVKKLLEICPNPKEIVDEKDAKDEVKGMINGKDYDGNTPLHLAASHCHPKVVQALTWDTRVDLHWLNNNNQTALHAFQQFKQEDNPPYPQASFTLPGGTNNSSPEQGMAVMLHHVWFTPFIFCITTSMYGGISVTIILLWVQLGDITLALFALNVATPLLGVTLATLSVAFLAGVHLVISDLNWLATTIMILCVIFILLLLLLYILLSLPSPSSNLIMRWISYVPFMILTWLFEKSSTEGRYFSIYYSKCYTCMALFSSLSFFRWRLDFKKLVEAKKKRMMKFLRCGGKICMNNNDVENNFNREEQSSRNVMEEKTVESSEEGRSDEAKAHGWWLLPKKTYDSIKENKAESDWREIDDETIKQERPRGNTVLHIAALYGNNKCVEKVLQIGPHLLLTINSNGDTALHVAARTGKISTLEKLVAALLHRNSEEAKEAILLTNKQGNTFFHEALLNGDHKNVMKILHSSPGFKQLAEETVFVSSNSNDKSVLSLAIEKGYEDIVDHVLTRMIPSNEGTQFFHTFKLPIILFFLRSAYILDSDMRMKMAERLRFSEYQGAGPAEMLKDNKAHPRQYQFFIFTPTKEITLLWTILFFFLCSRELLRCIQPLLHRRRSVIVAATGSLLHCHLYSVVVLPLLVMFFFHIVGSISLSLSLRSNLAPCAACFKPCPAVAGSHHHLVVCDSCECGFNLACECVGVKSKRWPGGAAGLAPDPTRSTPWMKLRTWWKEGVLMKCQEEDRALWVLNFGVESDSAMESDFVLLHVEGRMAHMDMGMNTRDISMPTLSKNLGARSPAIVAILKENKGILEKILNRKKEWIHDKDDKGRNALHYAASKGYLNGVECLLQKCNTCNMETDIDGFYPLHLASACGHIEVVKKLLENCPDPREIIDKKGRNIVHIAAIMGQFDVVRYVLQDANGVKDMINDKDYDGNTPLHLAASHYRPKIVQALTWDTSVDLNCLNNNNQTALDAFEQFKQEDNPPIVQANLYLQRLTWCQLKSAGVQNSERGSHSIQVPSSPFKPKAKNTEFYKDRINTLMLVSTLITTVAFAGGITLPGGTNSNPPGLGMALMLKQVWFKPYILCTTISMYGGISVTIILIWAQLGDLTLALFALKVARPLLGITLATLSVAFLAGVHLVISDLSWLTTTVLILCVVFITLLLLLYTLLWFPSESSNLIMRYISFYPFQFLTWLTEKDSIEGIFRLHDFDTDSKELKEHEYGGKQTEETEETKEHEYGGKQIEETEETEEVDEGENEEDDNDNVEEEDDNDNVEDEEDNGDEHKDTHE
ncbi:hypothetical protein V8G54_027546 [Vigna mungo]|uniref:PGG domain-containing protein n=1 Tax=Vigna mungo TaxID=3915 RepID=A0AAQ3N2S6_VIGMU